MAYKLALPKNLKDLSNSNLRMAVRVARSWAITYITSIRGSIRTEKILSQAPNGEFDSDAEEIRREIKECRSQLSVFCYQLAELEAEAKRRKLRITKWQTTKLEIDDALGRIPSRVN